MDNCENRWYKVGSPATMLTKPPRLTLADKDRLKMLSRRVQDAEAARRGMTWANAKTLQRLCVLAGATKGEIAYWDVIQKDLKPQYPITTRELRKLVKRVARTQTALRSFPERGKSDPRCEDERWSLYFMAWTEAEGSTK